MDAQPSRGIGFGSEGEYPFAQINGGIRFGMSGFGGGVIDR